MPRFRERLKTDTIYSDGESAFLTPDCFGGFWGQGDDPLASLQADYGDETPVEDVSQEFMTAIANDYDEPEGYDPNADDDEEEEEDDDRG